MLFSFLTHADFIDLTRDASQGSTRVRTGERILHDNENEGSAQRHLGTQVALQLSKSGILRH
jgi:hypothetical protein